jgi:cation/acetate symporter
LTNGLSTDLGFAVYTDGTKSMIDVFATHISSMVWYCGITSRYCSFLYC